MPQTFPVLDPATGVLTDTDYYTITEVADMLHVSQSKAYRLMRADGWPHLQIGNAVWLSPQDVGAVVESMRRNDGPVPEGAESQPGLGIPVPADPWVSDDDADQDPGGVR